jgi:hypothetical protein
MNIKPVSSSVSFVLLTVCIGILVACGSSPSNTDAGGGNAAAGGSSAAGGGSSVSGGGAAGGTVAGGGTAGGFSNVGGGAAGGSTAKPAYPMWALVNIQTKGVKPGATFGLSEFAGRPIVVTLLQGY